MRARSLFPHPLLSSFALVFSLALAASVAPVAPMQAQAQDIEDAADHPMVTRYPGLTLAWQEIENNRPYRIAVGAVTGYREIDAWIDTQGRVTRTFYTYSGADRTFSEVFLNYGEALDSEGFEIITQGVSETRSGPDVGSRSWTDVVMAANPVEPGSPPSTLVAGTSSQGGAGALIAKVERAAGTAYVVVMVEQHAAEEIGVLVDVVEVEAAETGLVAVDAEAIGADLEEFGRVVLDGIVFAFDKADILPESKPALDAVAGYLADHPDMNFYVVGHTDSVGTFAYNQGLSADRARAVVAALKDDYGVAADRLEPHGLGPLAPVFSNGSDAGRDRNRRVELVER